MERPQFTRETRGSGPRVEAQTKGSPSEYLGYHGTEVFDPRGIQLAREMDKRFNTGAMK